MTEREALALLKREFQLSPTLPAGGISVAPSVALDLCDELDRALVVVEAARALLEYLPEMNAAKGYDIDAPRLRAALVAFGNGVSYQHSEGQR